MRRYLLIFMVIVFINCNNNEMTVPNENMQLVFSGAKENYFRKGDFKFIVTDENVDSIIKYELQKLDFIWHYNTSGIIWSIDLYGTNGRLEYQLMYNFGDEYIFEKLGIGLGLKKQKWGKNDVLFNYLKDLFKVDEIGAYPGPMNQEIYDRVILKKYIPTLPDSSMH